MTMIINPESFLRIALRSDIVNAVDELMSESLEKHCKVFVMRFDVHSFEEDEKKNISKFTQRFIEKERRAGYDTSYIGVREISSNGNKHYHFAIFSNGNKTESVKPHLDNANVAINNLLGLPPGTRTGIIDECNRDHRNGIMIERNKSNQNDLDEVSRQLSYITKVNQKKEVKGKTFFRSISRKRKNQ